MSSEVLQLIFIFISFPYFKNSCGFLDGGLYSVHIPVPAGIHGHGVVRTRKGKGGKENQRV